MEDLYSFTRKLLKHLGNDAGRVEPHEPSDLEGSDTVWIVEENDGMSEGEYFSIAPFHPDSDEWNVYHNGADKVGGNPTYWSEYGKEEHLMPIVVELYRERKIELSDD